MASYPILICNSPIFDGSSLNSCSVADRIFVNLEIVDDTILTPTTAELAEYFGTGLVIPITIFLSVYGIAQLVNFIKRA